MKQEIGKTAVERHTNFVGESNPASPTETKGKVEATGGNY